MFSAVLVSLTLALHIPITNEVFIKGESLGKGSDMEGMMNQCFTGSYTGPGAGIIPTGETVKVVGPDVKVIAYLRGRCEKYYQYSYEIGACGTDSGMDTPSREFKADHPIQSYEIVQCKGGLGRDGSLSVEDAAAMRPDY